jgi:hypothetical protein
VVFCWAEAVRCQRDKLRKELLGCFYDAISERRILARLCVHADTLLAPRAWNGDVTCTAQVVVRERVISCMRMHE